MQDQSPSGLPDEQRNDLHGEEGGVIAIYTSSDAERRVSEGTEKAIVEACRRMGADAVIIESIDRAVVAAVDVYDVRYALAICDPCASLPSIARSLRVRLYRQACDAKPTAFLPAATVRSSLGHWERQIAVVFGRRYAAGLVSRAAGSQEPGKMTRVSLEEVRRRLSSAIGGCIELTAVK